MGEEGENPTPSPTKAGPSFGDPAPSTFDLSRSNLIGIIKRKALIKELSEAYHAECLVYCQELLELQKKWDEPYIDLKPREDMRKNTVRPPKRTKKSHQSCSSIGVKD